VKTVRVTSAESEKIMAPFKLDLISFFKVYQDRTMKVLEKSVKAGDSLEVTIEKVARVIEEEEF
jgi:hypothetical protein